MPMRSLLSLGMLPLLVACAGTGSPEREAPLTAWRFVSIDGIAPASDRAELLIYEGRLVASAGCNRLSAPVEVVPGQLKIGSIASTRMSCRDVMDQERALVELLGSSPGFFIEGNRFAMRSQAHSAELVKIPNR